MNKTFSISLRNRNRRIVDKTKKTHFSLSTSQNNKTICKNQKAMSIKIGIKDHIMTKKIISKIIQNMKNTKGPLNNFSKKNSTVT